MNADGVTKKKVPHQWTTSRLLVSGSMLRGQTALRFASAPLAHRKPTHSSSHTRTYRRDTLAHTAVPEPTHTSQTRDQVFKGTDITPSDVRVHVRGTSAFITCTEEVFAPSGAERRMLATNIYRKLEGRWVLVHHHASQAMVRGRSIEDILGGASGTRVIRIDGSTLSGGDGMSLSKAENSDDDIVDEIVRALQVREREQGVGSVDR